MRKIKNLNLSTIMSFLCFFASAIFTIALMQSQGYEFWAKLVFCIYAIPTEMGKYYFANEIFFGKKVLWRMYCTVLALMLFGISITASLVFSVNQANKLENDLKVNSIEYKQAQKNLSGAETKEKIHELTNNKNASIEIINKEIDELNESKKQAIAELEKTRDSYPSNYLTMKDNINKNIEKKRVEYNNKMSEKRKELLEIQSKEIVIEEKKLDSYTQEATKLLVEDGMSSVFGTEQNKERIFFVFSLVLELTGIGFYIDSRMKKNNTLGSKKFTLKKKDRPKIENKAPTNDIFSNDTIIEPSNFLSFNDENNDNKEEIKVDNKQPEIFFDNLKEFPKPRKLDL